MFENPDIGYANLSRFLGRLLQTIEQEIDASGDKNLEKLKPEIARIVAEQIQSHGDNITDAHDLTNRLALLKSELETFCNGKIADVVNSAPEVLDTLKELSDALNNDPNFANTVMGMLANKVNVDEVSMEPKPSKIPRLDEGGKLIASAIREDSQHRFITDAERENWNNNASAVIPIASPTQDGLMSSADKTKLDGLSPTLKPINVINSLDSIDTSAALSAAQGMVLQTTKANVIHTHQKSEVGLGLVDNTPDTEKNVATAKRLHVKTENSYEETINPGGFNLLNAEIGKNGKYSTNVQGTEKILNSMDTKHYLEFVKTGVHDGPSFKFTHKLNDGTESASLILFDTDGNSTFNNNVKVGDGKKFIGNLEGNASTAYGLSLTQLSSQLKPESADKVYKLIDTADPYEHDLVKLEEKNHTLTGTDAFRIRAIKPQKDKLKIEFAVADDGNEGISFARYRSTNIDSSGVPNTDPTNYKPTFDTIVEHVDIFDADGNTNIPNNLNVGGKIIVNGHDIGSNATHAFGMDSKQLTKYMRRRVMISADDINAIVSGQALGTPFIPEIIIDLNYITDDRIIYEYLKSVGLGDVAACAILGNLYELSKLNTKKMVDTAGLVIPSMTEAEYTTAVDNSTYTNFAHDNASYGIAQWVSSTHKDALLTYARTKSKSIGDLQTQLEFLNRCLRNDMDFNKLLNNDATIDDLSDIIIDDYLKIGGSITANARLQISEYGYQFYDKLVV